MKFEKLVTIGIPVYNSEHTIAACINSALHQEYPNLEILISDNASSDNTSKICMAYAELDSRVKYFRQDQNIGALANFNFVLKRATGHYFSWLAADDVISNNAVSESVELLEASDDLIACALPSLFDYELLRNQKPFTFQLSGSQISRLRNFFKTPGRSHGLYYSVIRREKLLDYPFFDKDFFASDWCFILFLLSKGPFTTAQNSLLTLGSKGASSKSSIYADYGLQGFKRILPFNQFASHAVKSGDNWSLLARFFLLVYLPAFTIKNFLMESRVLRYQASHLKDRFLNSRLSG